MRVRSWVALLLVVLSFQAAQGAVTDPSAALAERIQVTEAKLKSAKTRSVRLDVVNELQSYLDQSIKKLPENNPNNATRELRASLWSYKGYLGDIDTKAFSDKKCPQYHAMIYMGFNPKGHSAVEVPSEARTALKFLSMICEDPKLAE